MGRTADTAGGTYAKATGFSSSGASLASPNLPTRAIPDAPVSGGDFCALYNTATPGSADYVVWAKLHRYDSHNPTGPIGRCASGSDAFYAAWYAPSLDSVMLWKRSGGSFTQLGGTVPVTFTAGTDLWVGLDMSGTTIRCVTAPDSGGAPGTETEWVSVTDSDITAAGFAGFWANVADTPGESVGLHVDALLAIDDTAGGGGSATTYTFTGPTSGTVNVASTNFTITPDDTYTGTITPASDGSGTFSPTSLTWSGASDAKTFTYTPTSTTGSPHTLSTSSSPALTDPATIDYTVNAGPVTITVDDTDWFFSPFNWVVDGADSALSQHPGAYMKLVFSGTSAKLNVDVSALTGASVAAKKYPRIRYAVDSDYWTDYQLTSGDTQLTLATGLADTTHTLECHLVGVDAYTTRYSAAPISALKVTGLELDAGGGLSAPTLRTGRLLAYGDSITEGAWATNGPGDTTDYSQAEDGLVTWVQAVAQAFGCEYGICAFGGQSWDSTFNSDVAPFTGTWDDYYSGASRLTTGALTPTPDHVLENMGANGGPSTSAEVTTWITDVRAAADPSAHIWCVVAFNGTGRTNVTNGVAGYTADANAHLIDLGTIDGFASYDGLHPDGPTESRLGAQIVQAMQEELGGGGGGGGTAGGARRRPM